jgi:GNAT superfamily N-acetyltransferase
MGSDAEVVIDVATAVGADELYDLYSSVEWVAYTRDRAALGEAIANSTYVVTARSGSELVGLARGMSDDVSIFYLQDILVRPDWQHRGVGRLLLQNCLDRFAHVRQKVLLTDNMDAQHRFYRSMGFTDSHDLGADLHTFVQIEGIEIEH